MSEQDSVTEVIDELAMLKDRADIMGIKYHPNIGLDKLKEKINAKHNDQPDPDEEMNTILASQEAAGSVQKRNPTLPTPEELRAERKNDALRLVRIRVANMNPIKAAMSGEIIQVGNAELGVIKKFVPFNAEQGWHVPAIILQELKAKKYMSHYTVKDGKKLTNKHKLVPEYSIEILDPLTSEEMKDLANRQLMANKG